MARDCLQLVGVLVAKHHQETCHWLVDLGGQLRLHLDSASCSFTLQHCHDWSWIAIVEQ